MSFSTVKVVVESNASSRIRPSVVMFLIKGGMSKYFLVYKVFNRDISNGFYVYAKDEGACSLIDECYSILQKGQSLLVVRVSIIQENK